ncbi:MAG: hypothetical protein NT040_03775 [Bacteroidetes bacterium]|nr:hypothetical protein [Bacteroidota bacterium]
MSFRFYKRANLGGGLGLNVSKSGISPSFRTKYGSFGSRGFSIPTGIRGLYYRGGSGGKNAGLVILILMLLAGVFVLAYWLIVGIARGVVFLYFRIVKEDHIAYGNLIVFLSVVLGILMMVYLSLPPKGIVGK